MSHIAVSSWALHRVLGVTYPDSPAYGPQPKVAHAPGELPLLALPAELRRLGYDRLELCHFHLPAREEAYLNDLRAALAHAGVTLQTLLIDEGDPSDPVTGGRDADWIARWIDTAAEVGAQSVRVIAGKQPWGDETLETSARHLARLARHANKLGVRARIENWFDLLDSPERVNRLLDRLTGEVGLCLDFGNWRGADKYERLARIAQRAETCHAKAEFLDAGTLLETDFGRCLDVMEAAGYAGPYVIVSGGKGECDWDGIRLQRDFILARSAASGKGDGATTG